MKRDSMIGVQSEVMTVPCHDYIKGDHRSKIRHPLHHIDNSEECISSMLIWNSE